jgi:hypothetical protein
MKKILPAIFLLAIIPFVSCNKFDCKKDKDYKICTINNSELSTDNNYEDFYNWQAPGVEQYILEKIVVDPSCNCIVSGFVKYLKDGKTIAMVNYGEGDCDEWATKVNCIDGSCSEKDGAYCTKFKQDCGSEDPLEDPMDMTRSN